MKDKFSTLLSKVYNLKNKIAFFPSIIALAGVIFAYIMMFAENQGISAYLQEFLPELVINDEETARTILATFIAGLTSIMVFSFSMVMILLNQASSNFSPRLLPGLISNRRHQIVLGIYLFTIIYCIFILVFIEPKGQAYQLPGFSVLLSIVFMISSLASFIYFIHSISQEIQINNILLKIYVSAEKKIVQLINDEEKANNEVIDTKKWVHHNTKCTGYFKLLSLDNLIDLAHKNNFKLEVLADKGSYCSEDAVLFKTNIAVNKDLLNKIHANFSFSKGQLIDDNYLLAFKQITEVAVKSMSPGINDPGTAINAIDYLSELLILRVQKKNIEVTQKDNVTLVLVNSLKFEDLLYPIMASLRTYCSHDIVIVLKLLTCLKNVEKKSKFEEYNTIINTEISNLLADANTNITNIEDLKRLESMNSMK